MKDDRVERELATIDRTQNTIKFVVQVHDETALRVRTESLIQYTIVSLATLRKRRHSNAGFTFS